MLQGALLVPPPLLPPAVPAVRLAQLHQAQAERAVAPSRRPTPRQCGRSMASPLWQCAEFGSCATPSHGDALPWRASRRWAMRSSPRASLPGREAAPMGVPPTSAAIADRLHPASIPPPSRLNPASIPPPSRRVHRRVHRPVTMQAPCEGMVAVVTGGRVRIGYAIVLKLLRAGANPNPGPDPDPNPGPNPDPNPNPGPNPNPSYCVQAPPCSPPPATRTTRRRGMRASQTTPSGGTGCRSPP